MRDAEVDDDAHTARVRCAVDARVFLPRRTHERSEFTCHRYHGDAVSGTSLWKVLEGCSLSSQVAARGMNHTTRDSRDAPAPCACSMLQATHVAQHAANNTQQAAQKVRLCPAEFLPASFVLYPQRPSEDRALLER